MNSDDRPLRILVMRRDNIGDLVCTTPLIRALRQQFPGAEIDALVNSYNAPVLAGNPDLNTVYAYQKAKHRGSDSLLAAYGRRARMIFELRRKHYDWMLLPGGTHASALRFAKWIKPRQLLVRGAKPIPGLHEVEQCCELLVRMNLPLRCPPMVIHPDADVAANIRAGLVAKGVDSGQSLIALHITARKKSQRWPAERFAALARRLHDQYQCAFLLFWAPGSEHNPTHPGDDEKATAILEQTSGLPIFPIATTHLSELIAGLSLCDRIICSDGGALHIGAALGKPMICFFGNSEASRWYPWAVPHEVLQKDSLEVSDITVDETLAACDRLTRMIVSTGEEETG